MEQGTVSPGGALSESAPRISFQRAGGMVSQGLREARTHVPRTLVVIHDVLMVQSDWRDRRSATHGPRSNRRGFEQEDTRSASEHGMW